MTPTVTIRTNQADRRVREYVLDSGLLPDSCLLIRHQAVKPYSKFPFGLSSKELSLLMKLNSTEGINLVGIGFDVLTVRVDFSEDWNTVEPLILENILSITEDELIMKHEEVKRFSAATVFRLTVEKLRKRAFLSRLRFVEARAYFFPSQDT